MATATAQFASRRSDLIVIERSAEVLWEQGRQVGRTPARAHQFRDHQYKAEGQKTIEFLRDRSKAADGPEIWELDGASDIPSSLSLLSELATAEISRVRDILAAEEAGPNREEVIATCQRILEKAGAAEHGPGARNKQPRHEVVTD